MNETSARMVFPAAEEATIVRWYAVDEARPRNVSSWRVSGSLTASQSIGLTPTGPHCRVAVDGSDVVHATEVENDDTRAAAALVKAKPAGGGEVVVAACVVAGGAGPLLRYPSA